jgi:hypothetical protein
VEPTGIMLRGFFCTVAVVLAAMNMGGCSSVLIDSIPTWAGGEPADTPERPAVQPDYPPVNERPPPRSATVVTEAEQARIEKELTEARDAQTERAKDVQADRDGMLANTPQAPAKPY